MGKIQPVNKKRFNCQSSLLYPASLFTYFLASYPCIASFNIFNVLILLFLFSLKLTLVTFRPKPKRDVSSLQV